MKKIIILERLKRNDLKMIVNLYDHEQKSVEHSRN